MAARDIEGVVQWAVIGGIAYLLYQTLNKAGQAAADAGRAVGDATGSLVADFYKWAVLDRQAMPPLGNIILPDGSLVSLQNVGVRQSPDNQVYANYQGHFYQLYPADDNGNWPSVLVQ
jgi:hypothetical protein